MPSLHTDSLILCQAPPPPPLSLSYIHTHAGCTTEEALEAASLHPAQVLGQEGHKGTLEFGSDADLVLLDQDLHVQATFIAGQLVWRAPQGTIT